MPETEAEALLRSGALYPIRLGLRAPGRPLIFAGFKHGAFSLYFGDDPSYHFDLEGRWRRGFVDPSHLLRRLDGSTQAIDRPRVGRNMVLDRRTLDDAEAAMLDESIRSMALDLSGRIVSGALSPVAPPPPSRPIGPEALRSILDRIARWDADAWAEHRCRHRATYGPPPLLPPDSQDALVLQATVGQVPRSPEAFGSHCREVADLLGLGAVGDRALFLAGPDVLRRPADEVEAYLRIARDAFPLADAPAPPRRSDLPIDRPHREAIHAYLGRSDGPIPLPDDWRRHRSLGLRRVAIGIDATGARSLDEVITPRHELGPIVGPARAAGVAISVLSWIGHGPGDPPGQTAALIGALGLGKGDHVYVLDGDDRPGAAPGRGERAGASPGRLGDLEAELLEALAPLKGASGVRVLPYSGKKQGR